MRLKIATLAAAFLASGAAAQAQTTGTATLQDRDGTEIGTVTLSETASGRTLVVVEATNLPAGQHGVHVHETGDCSADDFTSAGGHLAGDAQHGVLVEGGPHPGDLPNAHVQEDGVMAFEAFVPDLLLEAQVFDADGSAIVVHAGADDYQSQPSGDSGDRIACGVIEQD